MSCYNNWINNTGYSQSQMYVDLQKQSQAQDKVHCNSSFGMLLSSMESLFIKSNYNIPSLFGHYDHFNDISNKSKEQIMSQINVDLMAYKIPKMAFSQKYRKEYVPDYPPISKIIEIVENWSQMAKKKTEKHLCKEILDLIKNENEKPLSYYQNNVHNSNSFSRADPTKALKMSSQIHDRIDRRNQEINKRVEENPNAKFGIEIGGQPGNSEFSHLNPNLDYRNVPNDAGKKKVVDCVVKLFEKVTDCQNNKINVDELHSFYKQVENVLNEYYSKNRNLNVLFEEIKLVNYLDLLRQYSNSFFGDSRKIMIYNNIENMFTNFNER